MNDSRKWIAAAREAYPYDMGVMTAKEKSIYRAFIELDDRIALLEKVAEYHGSSTCGCPACTDLRAAKEGI